MSSLTHVIRRARVSAPFRPVPILLGIAAAGGLAISLGLPAWVPLFIYSGILTVMALRRGTALAVSSAVYCELGNSQSEAGANGLRFVEFFGDGIAPQDSIDGVRVRRSDNRSGNHYIYFAIDEGRASEFRDRLALLIVEYFDLDQHLSGPDQGKRGLAIHYDANGVGIEHEFRRASTILFQSTMQWRYAAVPLGDGFFGHRQQGVADVRFSSRTATPDRDYNVAIRRVFLVPI